jgi:hypothetical protein
LRSYGRNLKTKKDGGWYYFFKLFIGLGFSSPFLVKGRERKEILHSMILYIVVVPWQL